MFIESGVIIFIGLLLIFIKLPRPMALWLLGHELLLDIAVSVVAFIMHYGTFSGIMAATVAGLMCSSFTWIGRTLFGYIRNGRYYRGYFMVNLTTKKAKP